MLLYFYLFLLLFMSKFKIHFKIIIMIFIILSNLVFFHLSTSSGKNENELNYQTRLLEKDTSGRFDVGNIQ